LFGSLAKDFTKKPVFVFGQGIGGALAIHLGLLCPEDIKGIILSAPLIVIPAETYALLQKLAVYVLCSNFI
jgi:alpha-beta hydrolase superfamily lysophospholipase